LRSHRIEANGVELVVHDWGGDGAPTLLAHATGFHGLYWRPVAERLVAAGRRVWSFDFHGHGDSSAPPATAENYSWHRFADDALAVVADLGIGGDPQLVACGHSKGGASLLLGEAKAPGTYPRMWAYEPIIFPTDRELPPAEDFPLARSARKRRNEWPSPEAAYESYASRPPFEVMTAESLHAYVDDAFRRRDDGVYELKCRPDVEAQVYMMGPNHGAYSLLAQVQSLVAVVCGETSPDISPELAVKIAARLPHGHVEVMPGLGHFGPQQDPDGCVASIVRFASADA
jgi:pimeloyl-ACP methyl ester carboxylesterase